MAGYHWSVFQIVTQGRGIQILTLISVRDWSLIMGGGGGGGHVKCGHVKRGGGGNFSQAEGGGHNMFWGSWGHSLPCLYDIKVVL